MIYLLIEYLKGNLHPDSFGFIPSPFDREAESPLVTKGGVMNTEQQERSIIIAEDNDTFRKNNPASYLITAGALNHCDIANVIYAVRDFSDFNEDNDPYGEHDFGSFKVDGQKLFWKIDYYDSEHRGYCDPLANECRRVLTIMLAEEY